MFQHFVVSDGIMGDHTITGCYKSPLDAVHAWLKCHRDSFFIAIKSLDFIDCLIVSDTGEAPDSYFVKRDQLGNLTLIPAMKMPEKGTKETP